MTRYFVRRDANGAVISVGKSNGAAYPDMTETDQAGYENALSELEASA